MEKSLNTTPVSNRVFIGFFGRMNAGKSSLVNALAGQSVSIVSDEAGTTTDAVRKTMEIHGIGPCVLIDTAGFDDGGTLGRSRVAAAERAAQTTDIAVVLFSDGDDWEAELTWLERFREDGTPVLAVISRADKRSDEENKALSERILKAAGIKPVVVSAAGYGLDELREELIKAAGRCDDKRYIMGELIREGDTVLLVMPQDPQAPEGRLIVPQVQTIREALDRHVVTVCVQPEEMAAAIDRLKAPPELIVTDSQIFDRVYEMKPAASRLTSFSVLFAAYKGDIDLYKESVRAIERLTESSRVLIAECCTHAPMDEDIGRVKIPRLLKKRMGEGLRVDITAGADFPEDIGDYDLIIQCGACMFNRKYVYSRIRRAKEAGVPMTNYGVTIAYLKGILDKIDV